MNMLYQIIFLTCIFEIATILGRLIWGSKKEKFQKKATRYKVRIHHGYTGMVLLLPGLMPFTLIGSIPYIGIISVFGWAFLLSDSIHHFIVLPLWVKRTEFP